MNFCTRVLLVAIVSFLSSPVASVDSSDTPIKLRDPNPYLSTGKLISEKKDTRGNRYLEDCKKLKDYTKSFNIDIKSSWRCHDGVFPYDDQHPKPKFCDNKTFYNHCKETCGLCNGKKKDPKCKDNDSKVSIFFKDWPVKCEEGLWNNGSIKKDYCNVEEFK